MKIICSELLLLVLSVSYCVDISKTTPSSYNESGPGGHGNKRLKTFGSRARSKNRFHGEQGFALLPHILLSFSNRFIYFAFVY